MRLNNIPIIIGRVAPPAKNCNHNKAKYKYTLVTKTLGNPPQIPIKHMKIHPGKAFGSV